MNNAGSVLAAFGAGAGLSYLLDPSRGARRRARIRDAAVHAANMTGRAIDATSRDAMHRTYGTAASLRNSLRRRKADDNVLIERVRAKLGRVVSHPRAIDVLPSDGVITLRGPILAAEAPRLIRAVGRVRGVTAVVNELELHDDAANVPSLQGGRRPVGDRLDVLQRNWSPTTRCVAGTVGATLAAAGATRRDLPGTFAALIGGGLLARAITNAPLNTLVGVGTERRAVQVQKSITISAPVGEVFAFWSWYENFPRFMSRVLEVKPSDDGTRSHWKVAGPAGVPVTFDAKVTRVVQNQLIAWQTTDGSPVGHAGVVHFERAPDGRTRVHIRMWYNPPAGWLGHGIAAAFGVDPKHSMDADLARMKTLIETGNAPHDAAWRRKNAE